jgi:hypothetical protein
MIALDFFAGTRTTSTLPLVDDGVSLELDGAVVSLELRWPDDPAVARPRYTWLAVMAQVERELYADDGSTLRDVSPDRQGELLAAREAAMTAYAVALVAGWSISMPCTPDAVAALFSRAPFALTLVVQASGEQNRFLPSLLRTAASESASLSAAPS